MCGRFAFFAGYKGILKIIKKLNNNIQIPSNYNIFPTQRIAVITQRNNSIYVEWMKWGLVPFWSKEGDKQKFFHNARSETVTEKSTFKNSFFNRRCIIPANGYYEWQQTDKNPVFIYPKKEELFFFAGIWESFSENGLMRKSCAVLTKPAQKNIESIHPRMPLIIKSSHMENWLNFKNTDVYDFYSDIELDWHFISKEINNPKNNFSALMKESQNI